MFPSAGSQLLRQALLFVSLLLSLWVSRLSEKGGEAKRADEIYNLANDSEFFAVAFPYPSQGRNCILVSSSSLTNFVG